MAELLAVYGDALIASYVTVYPKLVVWIKDNPDKAEAAMAATRADPTLAIIAPLIDHIGPEWHSWLFEAGMTMMAYKHLHPSVVGYELWREVMGAAELYIGSGHFLPADSTWYFAQAIGKVCHVNTYIVGGGFGEDSEACLYFLVQPCGTEEVLVAKASSAPYAKLVGPPAVCAEATFVAGVTSEGRHVLEFVLFRDVVAAARPISDDSEVPNVSPVTVPTSIPQQLGPTRHDPAAVTRCSHSKAGLVEVAFMHLQDDRLVETELSWGAEGFTSLTTTRLPTELDGAVPIFINHHTRGGKDNEQPAGLAFLEDEPSFDGIRRVRVASASGEVREIPMAKVPQYIEFVRANPVNLDAFIQRTALGLYLSLCFSADADELRCSWYLKPDGEAELLHHKLIKWEGSPLHEEHE